MRFLRKTLNRSVQLTKAGPGHFAYVRSFAAAEKTAKICNLRPCIDWTRPGRCCEGIDGLMSLYLACQHSLARGQSHPHPRFIDAFLTNSRSVFRERDSIGTHSISLSRFNKRTPTLSSDLRTCSLVTSSDTISVEKSSVGGAPLPYVASC